MPALVNHPFLAFLVGFALMTGCAWLGANVLGRRIGRIDDAERDFDIVLGASLTLLGLLIGFAFSMAVTRYDQRRNFEEAEANAIGTEYLRAGLLGEADAGRIRPLLREYLGERVRFYQAGSLDDLSQIRARTLQLQGELWSAVEAAARAEQTPVRSLVAAGMNDVLNSEGYTQAAWWNRIPRAAWALMLLIAAACNVLVGVRAYHVARRGPLLAILPIITSVAFFLIADIDSPRGGVIRVNPMNLIALEPTLR